MRMPLRVPRRLSRGRLATLCAAVLAACVSATEPLEIVTRQAELVPMEGFAFTVSGSVAVVIGERQTQFGISVTGAPPSASLGWAVREGRCSGVGSRVGPATAYPPIAVSTSGTGASEMVLFRRIATTDPFAAIVFDADESVLACADLGPGE